jgi:TonB family protein
MRRDRAPLGLLAVALVVSVQLHIVVLGVVGALHVAGWLFPAAPPADKIVELISIDDLDPRPHDEDPNPDDPPKPDEEEPPPPPVDVNGQLVEIAPPDKAQKPDKADYLAEYDQTVAEETRSERYEVNPQVLANRWSPEQKVQMKGDDVADLDMSKPSTGAQVGSDAKFDPSRDGMLASTPSKWKVTNRDGLEDPVPASALQSILAGAPQNDLLREKKGAETSLNTKEFMYASYLLRIRRLVNFYWNQNLHNLPNSVRLARPEYTTTVRAVLDSHGALDTVDIKEASGSTELDDAVERAFRVAGPYPNPPAGLVSADGRVYLPDMGFTVELGVAQMHYEGVDPRAGVQFPGILKSPR